MVLAGLGWADWLGWAGWAGLGCLARLAGLVGSYNRGEVSYDKEGEHWRGGHRFFCLNERIY